jgi:hypothetical protein
MSGRTMFFIFVGVLVAVVMSFLIYDRVSEYLDKRRFRALNRDSIHLITSLSERERELQRTDKRLLGYELSALRKMEILESDPEWKRLNDRLMQVEWDRGQILRDHPEWGP